MVSSFALTACILVLLTTSVASSLTGATATAHRQERSLQRRYQQRQQRRRRTQTKLQQADQQRVLPPYFSQGPPLLPEIGGGGGKGKAGGGKKSHSKADSYYEYDDEGTNFYYYPDRDDPADAAPIVDGSNSSSGENDAAVAEADTAFDAQFSSSSPNTATLTSSPTEEPVSGRDDLTTEEPTASLQQDIISIVATEEPEGSSNSSTSSSLSEGDNDLFDDDEVEDIGVTVEVETEDGSNETSSSETNTDSETSLTAEFCPDVSADKIANVTWTYAVEFRPAVSEEAMRSVINVLELQLVSELSICDGDATRRQQMVRRRLLLDGIAGLDYMPRDTQRMNEVCFSNQTIGGICNTYNGRMQVYLEQTANGQVIINEIRSNIQQIMQRSDFASLPEVVRVWYIGPEISSVSEISRGTGGSTAERQQYGSAVSTGGVVAFAALGFFVFGALMLGMFRVRGRNTPVDETLTIEPDSAMTTKGNDPPTARSPKVSPFSAMLPSAYNLHDAETMSAILEGDSDSDSRASLGSVIVSEGGFTTDGEESTIDGSVYTRSKLEPVLGAHRMDDEDSPNDSVLLFEDDNDMVSSIDKA